MESKVNSPSRADVLELFYWIVSAKLKDITNLYSDDSIKNTEYRSWAESAVLAMYCRFGRISIFLIETSEYTFNLEK